MLTLDDDQCSEFMVMPPTGRAFDDPQLHERIRAALVERFPAYNFIVTCHGEWRDDEAFTLIPVLGAVGGTTPLLQAPSFDLMGAIGVFLYETFMRQARPASIH